MKFRLNSIEQYLNDFNPEVYCISVFYINPESRVFIKLEDENFDKVQLKTKIENLIGQEDVSMVRRLPVVKWGAEERAGRELVRCTILKSDMTNLDDAFAKPEINVEGE